MQTIARKEVQKCFRLDSGYTNRIDALAARWGIARARTLQLALTHENIAGHTAHFRCPETWSFVGSYLAPGQYSQLKETARSQSTNVAALARACVAAFLEAVERDGDIAIFAE
jgi:hypothetical protein